MSPTNLDPQSQTFLSDVNRTESQLSIAEDQLTSGKRVNVASDDPDVVSQLLSLRSALQRNTQIQTNLGIEQAAASVADTALTNAIQMLDQAQTLAAQGVTATVDASTRAGLASDVEGVLDEMVSLSQTESAGTFVFGGDQATQPSYQVDLANDNGVDQLVTTQATRQVENPAGGSFQASMTAQDIFDDRNADGSLASDNVFAALNSLRTALQNNDVDGINSALTSLSEASAHLNACQSFYGSVENRLQDAVNFASTYNVQIQSQISQYEDADIAAASLEFTQGSVQLEAAFQMEGQIPRTTLFNYLSST